MLHGTESNDNIQNSSLTFFIFSSLSVLVTIINGIGKSNNCKVSDSVVLRFFLMLELM